MDSDVLRSFCSELNTPMVKQALIERLIRLGATDIEDLPGVNRLIKKTPRLIMRHRSPEELGALQHGVTQAFNKLEQPVVDASERMVSKLPGLRHPKVAPKVNLAMETMIRNPLFLAAKASPIPGSSFAVLAGQKGLERAIDRFAPVPLPQVAKRLLP